MNLARWPTSSARGWRGSSSPDGGGRRPCHGEDGRYADDPHWRDLVLFHEYFHGDTGRGLGASHQTGWTALVRQKGFFSVVLAARGGGVPRAAQKNVACRERSH
jgi:hypothetical protein